MTPPTGLASESCNCANVGLAGMPAHTHDFACISIRAVHILIYHASLESFDGSARYKSHRKADAGTATAE